MASTTVLLAAAVANAQPATTSPTTSQPVYATPATADPVEALGRYLRVLSTMPRNLDALTGAGKAALAIGDANAAISFFARAEEISPRDGRIKFGLASALVQVEQPKTALKLFADAVSLGVPDGEVAGERGLAYDLRGDSRRAQADYAQSLRWRPDDEITRRLAVSQAISGDRQAALATLDALLRRQDRAAWRIRAFVLALTGDQKGAQDVAVAVMPRGQADALTPYFSRLAALGPAQKAAAVHLGQFPSDGRGSSSASAPVFADAVPSSAPVPAGGPRSDVPLIPSGTALGSGQTIANARSAQAPRRRPGATELAGFSAAATGSGAATVPARPQFQPLSPQLRSLTEGRQVPASPPAAVAATAPPPVAPPVTSAPAISAIVPAPIVQQPRSTAVAPPPAYTPPAAAVTATAPTSPPVRVAPTSNAPTAAAVITTPPPSAPVPAATPAAVPTAIVAAPTTSPPPSLATAAPTAIAAAQATAPIPPPVVAETSATMGASTPVTAAATTPAASVPLPAAAPAAVTNSADRVGPGFSADPVATSAVAAPGGGDRSAAVFGPPAPVELAMASPSPAVTGFAANPPAVRAIDLPGSAAAEPMATRPAPSPVPAPVNTPVQRPAATSTAARQSRVITPAAKAPAKVEVEEKPTAAKVAAKAKEGPRGKAADDRPTRLAAVDVGAGTRKAASAKAEKAAGNAKEKADAASAAKDAKAAKDSKDAKDPKDAKDLKGKNAAAKDAAAKDAAAKDAKPKDAKSKEAATREADAKEKTDKAAKTLAGERYWVQVASGANRADLGKAWERTKAKAPKLLGGRATYTAPWKQSNRLLVGPFKSEGEAQGFVNSLSKAGTGGIQFTSRGGMKVEPLANE